MNTEYYDLLGVSKGASEGEIKKAFRKKAQEFHPDKPNGDEKKFKAVNEAYSVLSNKEKRQQYDSFGKAGAQGPGGAGGFGQGGFDFSGFQQGAGGCEFDLGDIFSQFGGGGFGGRQRQRRGDDISVALTISFKESVFGVEKEFTISKNSECDSCDGSGAEGKKTKTCGDCQGSGQVTMVQNTMMGQVQSRRSCPACNGSGEIPEVKCKTCSGAGVRKKDETVKVKIPAGIEDGQQLRLSNRGEAISGGASGDLYIMVTVTPDKNFKKVGSHLYTQQKISLTEAALGGKTTIDTFDGEVTVKIPTGSETGKQLRVKEKGFVITDKRRGDLYIELLIDVPQKLSKEQKKLLEQLAESGL